MSAGYTPPAGYSASPGYVAYAQQQNSSNQNMVMIVIGVAIGVFLILFLALLLLMGAGGIRAMEISPAANGVSADKVTGVDPAIAAARDPQDATGEAGATESLPPGIRRDEDNNLSIRWRAREGVVYDDEVDPLSEKSGADSNDGGFRFRPSQASQASESSRQEVPRSRAPAAAPPAREKREPHRYTANKSLESF